MNVSLEEPDLPIALYFLELSRANFVLGYKTRQSAFYSAQNSAIGILFGIKIGIDI